MNPLYPNVATNFAITAYPSAPAAIEEKECSVAWDVLPKAEAPSWYQVTKTRQVVAKTLGGIGLSAAGGAVYAGGWLTASPLVVIGLFSGFALTATALTITAIAFYAFSESSLDPQFRALKRVEAEKLSRKECLSFRQMLDYGPTVIAGDEVQELLRYDIQRLDFSQFIAKHGEGVMDALPSELLTSLKVKYLTHIVKHEAGKSGLQEVLEQKISKQFAVSLHELAADFISLELYRMYSGGFSYGEFINRNGKEAISYVVGSNYQNWFINKFFDYVKLEMRGKGAKDAQARFHEDFGYFGELVTKSTLFFVLCDSYAECVQNNQSYELFRSKSSAEDLKLFLAYRPLEQEKLRQNYLKMSYELMSGTEFVEDRILLGITTEDIQATMDARFKTMSVTDVLQKLMSSSKVCIDNVLHGDTKLVSGQSFAHAVENLIRHARDLPSLIAAVPSFLILQNKSRHVVQLIIGYLRKHPEEYLKGTLDRIYTEIVDSYGLSIKVAYQSEMAAIDLKCKKRLEEAVRCKDRTLVDAKARFAVDRLKSELNHAEDAKRQAEKPIVILRQSQRLNVSEMARITHSRRFSPIALQRAESALNQARQNQGIELQSHELQQLRLEISSLEVKAGELQRLHELQAQKQKIESQIKRKSSLEQEIEETEGQEVEKVQGIVQALKAYRRNNELERKASSKKKELWAIEQDELKLEGITKNIALLQAKRVDPNASILLQRKRSELTSRELAIQAAYRVNHLDNEVKEHLKLRDLEKRYAAFKESEVQLNIQLAAAEQNQVIAISAYERALIVFENAKLQYDIVHERAEVEYSLAVNAIKQTREINAKSCLQRHIAQCVV